MAFKQIQSIIQPPNIDNCSKHTKFLTSHNLVSPTILVYLPTSFKSHIHHSIFNIALFTSFSSSSFLPSIFNFFLHHSISSYFVELLLPLAHGGLLPALSRWFVTYIAFVVLVVSVVVATIVRK